MQVAAKFDLSIFRNVRSDVRERAEPATADRYVAAALEAAAAFKTAAAAMSETHTEKVPGEGAAGGESDPEAPSSAELLHLSMECARTLSSTSP